MKTVIYPGTFDPITNGHIDILRKASKLFDEIILSVASATGKNPIFSLEERAHICRQAVRDLPKVKVQVFHGLAVDFAKERDACAMIRGLRALSDFEYELSLALMNKKLLDKIDTIFFVPDNKYLYLSSSMVRQIVSLGGDIKDLLPPCVVAALKSKLCV